MGPQAATTQNGISGRTEEPNPTIRRFSEAGTHTERAARSGPVTNLQYLDESELVDPTEHQELALSAERIYENYPFYGTLMKLKGAHYRKVRDIPKRNPICIEDVERKYGAGEYELRLTTQDERHLNLSFTVEKEPEPASSPPAEVGRPDPMAERTQQKTAEAYEEIIRLLEDRNRNMQAELDRKSARVRELTEELAELDRQTERRKRTLRQELQAEIDRLKDRMQDLKFENFELQQELKYADADKSFSLVDTIKEAAKDPDTVKMLAPLMNKLFGGTMPQQGQPAALNGRVNPQQSPQEQPSRQPRPPAEEQDPSPEEPNQQSTPNQMQHMLQQFSSQVIQNAASSMLHGQPAAEQLGNMVLQGVKHLESNGMEIQPGMWIGISKQLVEFAISNSITAEKAAATIKPILEQFDGAASNLKFVPAEAAANLLISKYDITVTKPQREFLVKILDVFKQKLKES
ncbi:hypothetical protein [Halalkalibaculum sp. DA384]|uniref:hypothetical protein n=1 Tax=Halalkalibaculum sp. DA384 TaxID=3373606 RepID=UPI0037543960